MTPFHITSSEEVDEMTPDSGCRTIETGRTRERFRRNTAAGFIEIAVDRRFGKRSKNFVRSERPRRTARHERDEVPLSDGSCPVF